MIWHFIFFGVLIAALVGALYNTMADYSNGEQGLNQAIGAFICFMVVFADAIAWIIYAIVRNG